MPEDADAKARHWRAMGIDLDLSRQFDLVRSSAMVGRVRWEFACPKRGPALTVERIAMVDYWLKVPLRDWLAKELPPGGRTIRQEACRYNGHEGERLLTCSKGGIVASLRGRGSVRLDLAWRCPVEERLYHLICTELTSRDEAALPGSLVVRCCGGARRE
jgi:hypothetical protein